MFELNTDFAMIIIAVMALISPMITTWQNNRFQIKMKKLEMQEKQYENSILHKQEIFEKYVFAAGQAISVDATEYRRVFGQCHAVAFLYAPTDLQKKMSKLYDYLNSRNRADAEPLFEEIVPLIHKYLISLDKK